MSEPELIKGGQSRSAASLTRDANVIQTAFLILCFCAALLIVASGCKKPETNPAATLRKMGK